jgi:hypothetical protein
VAAYDEIDNDTFHASTIKRNFKAKTANRCTNKTPTMHFHVLLQEAYMTPGIGA